MYSFSGNAGSMPKFATGALILALSFFPSRISGDPNDWVNPIYVLSHSKNRDTAAARRSITSGAISTAKNGPWSVGHADILPPSKNPRDYLSWAPYHWPDCHWCPYGAKSHAVAETANATSRDSPGSAEDSNTYGTDSGDDINAVGNLIFPDGSQPIRRMCRRRIVNRKMDFSPRYYGQAVIHDVLLSTPNQNDAVSGAMAVPSGFFTTQTPTSTSTEFFLIQSPSAHNAAPKNKSNPTKTKPKGTSSCTPSPTRSLAPSATWTTCPYSARDGQVNADVRQLKSLGSLNAISQSALYNAISFALEDDRALSHNAASFIETFFLDDKTGMHPNMEFAQVVRGPGRRSGSYMGVLDMRVITKVINAVEVLRLAKSPDWTSGRDTRFLKWARAYLDWLETSIVGQKAQAAANNHGTFYFNQVGALKLFLKDVDGARAALKSYFDNQFQSQVAYNGEQPLEAVRSRPFHYRCFNLEAMIVNAKLGDQLGLDLWMEKSKYSATIQTALDYLMTIDPGKENSNELLPLVAAIAAAYGDPDHKYLNYLKNSSTQFKNKPFWFYNQAPAFLKSPTSQSKPNARRNAEKKASVNHSSANSKTLDDLPDDSAENNHPESDSEVGPPPPASTPSANTVLYPGRPAVFANTNRVQLEEGIFVLWSQVKKYYMREGDVHIPSKRSSINVPGDKDGL